MTENDKGPIGLPFRGVWIVDVLDLHPVAWRAELAARLDELMTFLGVRFGENYYIIAHLVHQTGCPVPISDGYVGGWLDSRVGSSYSKHPAHLSGGPGPGATALERLRADDLTPTFLPLVVERGIHLSILFLDRWMKRGGLRHVWEDTELGVFVSFSAEGLIDRAALIRHVFASLRGEEEGPDIAVMMTVLALTPEEHASVARERTALAEPLRAVLLQDEGRRETAPVLDYLRALAPTPAENAPYARDHVALLDLSSPVAAYGQEILNGVDEAGLLEPDVRTEMCERLLLRPEKKLVRAQLTRLDRAARKDPARAALTVLDAALAFDHRDVGIQERALDVVARHLGAAGDAVLPELRTAAVRINPGLTARAAELLGTAPDPLTEPYADTLPPVPEPRPVPDPIGTAVEVAEEFAAVIANDRDVVAFERVLDGLVRHAHLDRAALARSLKPAMRRKPRSVFDCAHSDVYDVAAALRGDEPREFSPTGRLGYGKYSPAGELLRARLAEAVTIIEAGAQPFLLAVPTDATGALDAAVLVRRISELDALGVTPAPVDLAQALLRTTPTADEEIRDAAGRLGSDAGQRLAQWLREGGLPQWDATPSDWEERHIRPETSPCPPLLPAAEALIGPYPRSGGYAGPMLPFWLAQLPRHSDIVLARDYFRFHYDRARGWARALPYAAESGGPAGRALHMALAETLAYDRQDERDAAVDALLVLAARGRLNTELLGQRLAEMLRATGANRVIASLRTAAETGAYATIWSLLEIALPRLLRDPTARSSTGALLALGVDCASRCAAKGEIPQVTTAAARTGSSQAVKNARLLRDLLG
ncbi:DUF6493 family protein [Streptomyces sp. NPDC093109]|uniref:DUF6493 family protein n=1 Tax=Streptomyces sp. NPDC093109 TaxID=3154977 RepID=UPI00344FA310